MKWLATFVFFIYDSRAHIRTKFDTLSLWAIGPGQHFFLYTAKGLNKNIFKKNLPKYIKKTSPKHSIYEEFFIRTRSYLGNSTGPTGKYKYKLMILPTGVL